MCFMDCLSRASRETLERITWAIAGFAVPPFCLLPVFLHVFLFWVAVSECKGSTKK